MWDTSWQHQKHIVGFLAGSLPDFGGGGGMWVSGTWSAPRAVVSCGGLALVTGESSNAIA